MAEIVLEITSGNIRGDCRDGVSAFKGIPYGASTAGSNRFLPPSPPAPWSGVRDCLAWGPICPQPGPEVWNISPQILASMDSGEGFSSPPASEDCLVLNVWTPAFSAVAVGESKRPVLFWCHGGGFFSGASSNGWYDGAALCRAYDVVVVSANHRLGVLGYLDLSELLGEEYAPSGNAGMLDLVLGLKWVHENIAAFGGDPGCVTVFGESGGGMKVSLLMAMPAARGLFQRAIIQSGPLVRAQTSEQARRNTRKVLRKLGLRPGPQARLRCELDSTPVERLVRAQVGRGLLSITRLQPVVDGLALPQHPFDPVAPDLSREIPLLIGTTKDEATLFLGKLPLLGTFSRPSLLSNPALQVATRILVGRRARRIITATRAAYPAALPNELFASLATEWFMRQDSIRIAERKLAVGGAPVFMYLFAWETPAAGGRLHAHHGLDIPFVFDNPATAQHTLRGLPDFPILAGKMSAAWAAFARDGNPNHPGLPDWPPYTLEERATMIFDRQCCAVNDPGREERLAWEGVRPPAI